MSKQHSPPLLLAPGTTPKPPNVDSGKKLPGGSTYKRWIWITAALVVFAAALYFIWPRVTAKTADTQGKGKGKNSEAPPAAPVLAAKSHQGNIGVYYTGLGTVTPLNTVTVKSRVDGQLVKVYYQEGQLVHQGDPLVEIDPRPYQVALEQAQGQLAKDQATLNNAKVDLNRYQTLFDEKVISEQQATTQKALVQTDQGAIEADQAQVDNAKLNITYTHITAPITGRAGLRLVDQGNMVHASDSNGLVVITQMQPISAIFTLAEDQLPVVLKKIGSGQKLAVDAYDREMKNKLSTGSLTTLDNQIDPTTGTLKLRATFDNQDSALYPNQFVNIRLLVEQKNGVTLVPSAALQRNTQNTYVYVVKSDSTVTVRNVAVGTTEGEESEITSGLTPGEVVVLTGVDKLQEGSKVNAQLQQETPSQDPTKVKAAGTNLKGK